MAKANANITIGAQTDKRSFQQTEQETKGFLNRLKRGGGVAGGEMGGVDASVENIDRNISQMNKLITIAATAEIALRAVQVGFDGISAAISSMSGEIEEADAKWLKFQEDAKQIPILGQVFSIGNMLSELVFQDSADAAKITENTERMAAALAKRHAELRKYTTEFNATMDKSADLVADAWESHHAAMLEGIERDVFLLRQQTVKRSDALYEQIQKFRELSQQLPAQQEEINRQIEALLNAQAQIWEQFNIERAAIEDKYAEERAQKEKAAADKMAAEQKRLADELADIETQNRAMMLRLEGEDLEAELVQLRHYYDKRIEMAEDAAIREALERQRAIAIETARENAQQQDAARIAGPVAAPSIVEGLRLTGASQMSGEDWQKITAERAREADQRRREEAKRAEKQREETRQILAEIARGGGRVSDLLAN